METLKVNISSDGQGSHPDDLTMLVYSSDDMHNYGTSGTTEYISMG